MIHSETIRSAALVLPSSTGRDRHQRGRLVYEITLGEPAIERLFQTYGVVPAAVMHDRD